jgi:Lipid A 3-O-deacylase (PagL)
MCAAALASAARADDATIQTAPARVDVGVPASAAVGTALAGLSAGSGESAGLDLAPAAVTYAQPQDQPKEAESSSPPPASPAPQAPSPARLRFGDPGSMWVTLGGGVASNGEEMDENIFGRFNYFIAKDVELFGELGAWQYSQPGKDSTAFNLSGVLRWHFYDEGKWTMFIDLGIGVMAATDPVPRVGSSEGTKFNFTPRLGGGVTRQITDDGVRLELGLRWAHTSNARISGANDNPGRDSMMLYAGLIFPFRTPPQQVPPPSTRKKASMSVSVPRSPSPLKSAVLGQGAGGQVPARHAKNASMSASVPRSPSQLKSALPHPPPGGRLTAAPEDSKSTSVISRTATIGIKMTSDHGPMRISSCSRVGGKGGGFGSNHPRCIATPGSVPDQSTLNVAVCGPVTTALTLKLPTAISEEGVTNGSMLCQSTVSPPAATN